MSDQALVLVLGNDVSLAAAKTSRHLCVGLNRIGRRAIGRDTRLNRWAAEAVAPETPERAEACETAIVAKWQRFLADYGVDTVIGLDLHWFFSAQLFVDSSDQIKRIHSFWFDDIRSHFLTSPMFPTGARSVAGIINDKRVTHHCYGTGQAEELRQLGIARTRSSALAASSELLSAKESPTRRDRLAFIGNPGLPAPPTVRALAAMERGAGLPELRGIARDEILQSLSAGDPTATWLREEPQVADLLAAATEARQRDTGAAALSLLQRAGTALPVPFAYLNRRGVILDAAFLVKLVGRYDRPALVHRLWKRGWLDVHGSPEQWRHFGIAAQPTISFPHLVSIYQRYPAHLNAANCAREATANEKLFEIAACGRTSLNLESPDVRACYADDEIVLVPDEEALEAAAEAVLRDPDSALAKGERARRRTAREHTWEHRLERAFA